MLDIKSIGKAAAMSAALIAGVNSNAKAGEQGPLFISPPLAGITIIPGRRNIYLVTDSETYEDKLQNEITKMQDNIHGLYEAYHKIPLSERRGYVSVDNFRISLSFINNRLRSCQATLKKGEVGAADAEGASLLNEEIVQKHENLRFYADYHEISKKIWDGLDSYTENYPKDFNTRASIEKFMNIALQAYESGNPAEVRLSLQAAADQMPSFPWNILYSGLGVLGSAGLLTFAKRIYDE